MKGKEHGRKMAFRYDVPVVWSDLDAKGHVSNLMFPVYIESARAVYYLGLLGTNDPMRIDFILARLEMDFKSPAFYNDILQVWIRPGKVGNTSFEFEYMVTKKGDGELIASARSVQVCLDYRTRKKRPVPPKLARLLLNDALCPFPGPR